MQRIGPGEYQCKKGENVQIEFFCFPGRDNVRIRFSFDGITFQVTDQNSIRFKMGDNDVNLDLQYLFILTGSCDNEITAVENRPNGEDIIATSASGGDTDFLTLTFHV